MKEKQQVGAKKFLEEKQLQKHNQKKKNDPESSANSTRRPAPMDVHFSIKEF